MELDSSIPRRKSIRLKEYDYSCAGEYFITICTYERECLFGEVVNEEMRLSEIGEIVKQYWQKIPDYYPDLKLDMYVIMPNHIHGIIILNDSVGAIHESPLQMTKQQRRNMLIPKIIGRFKMNSAKRINIYRNTMGRVVWQRNYYEHIIRNDKELNNIRDYVINNPVKWFYDDENQGLKKN